MNDYPKYNRFVKDVPAYVAKVREQADKYEVSYDDALAASQEQLDQYHTGPFGDMTRDPYDVFIEHAVESIDPFKVSPVVMSAHTNLYRAALTYWARQGNYKVSAALKWFDSVIEKYGNLNRVPHSANVWEEFFKTFPIELPRDEAGKVDAAALDQMTDLQRALITAQSAEVAETCATGGGDDTWFDYLPNGIITLSKLQTEDWAAIWADYINTMEAAPDEDGEDWEARMEVEEQLAEKYDLFIQDCTTVLLTHFL